NVAIGTSTLRNQGASGVNRAARDFLASVDLATFAGNSEAEFLAELDAQTEGLRRRLPSGAQHWGTARKAVNLFLGEAYYHRVLCEQCGLAQIARFLEVPLDRQVAQFLWKKASDAGSELPRWRKIKVLTPEHSRQYQEFATHYAQAYGEGWFRIHLD